MNQMGWYKGLTVEINMYCYLNSYVYKYIKTFVAFIFFYKSLVKQLKLRNNNACSRTVLKYI